MRRRVWQVTVAAVLLWLEGLAAVVCAVVLTVDVFTQPAQSVGAAVGLVLLALGVAAWLMGAAVRLAAGRGWARSSGVFWQLVMLALAAGALQGEPHWAIAAGLAAPALVIGALLFTRPVVEATQGRGGGDGERDE